MIHSLKRTSQICSMLCQFNPHWVFSENTLRLQRNRDPIFHIIRTIQTVSISISKKDPKTHSQIVSRISRRARSEAQNALLEYLHSTRSLQFTDAEHISKNSPKFIQKLLSKVESEQEIGPSITRFLRYHPINEFEPFFESLGLQPPEFSSLLPRDLMFLTDDHLLLDNFHALCNYGIPRSKIGKIYKEAPEIFRYNCSDLASILSDFERSGLRKTTVIKVVTVCPSLLIVEAKKDFFRVLDELKSLGTEYDWIGEALSEKHSYNWNKMLKFLFFLNKLGCSKKDLGTLIKKNQGFLSEDSGTVIFVLVGLLLKLGIVMSEILSLILQYPKIFCRTSAKNLLQCINFLADIGMETKDIAKIVCTHPHVLGLCSLMSSRTVLSSLNIGSKRLCSMILENPNQLKNWSLGSMFSCLPSSGEDEQSRMQKTNFLLKLGFVENSDGMTKALKQFRGRGDQLQERFDCLVDAGLDFQDVSNMIRVAPPVLNQKRDVIEKKIDYLVNSLGYPLESLIAFPSFLCYDIERIKLRFTMYGWLKEKGAIRLTLALSTILACSYNRFMKEFVNVHPEGPEVWEKLKKTYL